MNASNPDVRRVPLRLALLFACAATVAGPGRAAATDPPRFRAVSIQPFGSPLLTASALNDKGHVTGLVFHPVGGQNRAFPFVWNQATGRRDLVPPAGHTGASAGGINAQGDVVGFLTHPSFGTRGYVWRTNSAAQIVDYQLVPELQDRLPLAIGDDRRTICEQGYGTGDPAWVFDLVTRQVQDFVVDGTIVEGVNQATAVNGAGHVVGTISTRLPNGNVQPRAFLWSPGFAGWFLQLLPGPDSEWFWTDASDVNDSGDVVGFVMDLDDQSVAWWDVTGSFTDLGLAPVEFVTQAMAVNEERWIVGWSPNDHPLGLDTPFLWIDGTFHNLNHLVEGVGNNELGGQEDAGIVYRAHDVNEAGEILAELVHFSPALRFEDVLLVPIP